MPTRDSLLKLLPEEELNEIVKKVKPSDTPLWKYWDEFINISLDFWKSTETLFSVKTTMKFFLRHTDLNSLESWDSPVNTAQVLRTLIQERWWSAVTLNSHRKNMNTYFLFLTRFDYIERNPIMKIIKMPEQSKNKPTLTKAEIPEVLSRLMHRPSASRLEQLRNILFFQIAVITWARPKELLRLTVNSISSDRKTICINGAKQKGKERYYELNTTIQWTLSLYFQETVRQSRYEELSRCLFVSARKLKKPWTYVWVNKLFQRVSKEIGKRVTLYMVRRYACTELFANDIPIQNIQIFMWHNRLATTYWYNYNSSRNTQSCTKILWDNLIQ